MEANTLTGLNSNYQPPQKALWTGRQSDPDDGIQYWHQAIALRNAGSLSNTNDTRSTSHLVLLGYACEEGVRRNQGRIGTKQAPPLVRKQLARLPFHCHSLEITDVGDVICLGEEMEDCQTIFAEIISKLITNGAFPVAIGGGHDMAYAHFSGLSNAFKNNSSSPKIGIVNFDAHFDLRPVERRGNSGTPFAQIFSNYKNNAEYYAIGIQHSGNTQKLFNIARRQGVKYLTNYDCHLANREKIQTELETFVAGNDHIYITIDIDGFSSAYAPGVSAPSPLGFTPDFFFEALRLLMRTGKVISCDIAEVNPEYDLDNATVSLAARIVDFIAMNHSLATESGSG